MKKWESPITVNEFSQFVASKLLVMPWVFVWAWNVWVPKFGGKPISYWDALALVLLIHVAKRNFWSSVV